MKKYLLFAACALSLVACESGGGGVTSDKEAALQQAGHLLMLKVLAL